MTVKSKTAATRRKAGKGANVQPTNKRRIVPAIKSKNSPRRPKRSSQNPTERLRQRYHLSRNVLAYMVGVKEATLTKWENGATIGAVNLSKINRVQGLLRKLEQSMRRSYIATWLSQPSEACADLGVNIPADLFARGDYEAIEEMIFFLGSGVAF
jgi:DNA-binding transcriptional regulator YiaG